MKPLRTRACKECGKDYIEKWARAICRPCYRLKNLESSKKYRKNFKQKKFKVDPKVLELGSGKCKICLRFQPLVFDHCHNTETYRGSICNGCNVALGMFRDEIKTIWKALVYIAVHRLKIILKTFRRH